MNYSVCFIHFDRSNKYTLLYIGKPKTCTLANNDDPDEMPKKVAFQLGLYCLLRLKQSSETELHLDLDILTCDLLL